MEIYRVTHQNGYNLPLTLFQLLRQLLGRYCSYLLPRQDGGTSQIQVNGRFLPSRYVTLYSLFQILALVELFNAPSSRYARGEVYLLPKKIDEYVARWVTLGL